MRSGTSLTRLLLSQHPDFFGTFETHWFCDAVRLDWNDPASRRMQLLIALLDIEKEYETLAARKREQPEREFIDIVMEFCAQRAGAARWVEKTPDNLHHWSLIGQQWPDARLVHVTREYKDVFASWKTKRREPLDVFLSAAHRAYKDIEPLLDTRSEWYCEVDYNELVRNTIPVIRDLLTFVGAPWDEACTQIGPGRSQREREHVRAVLGRESPTAKSLTQPINADGIGQWRNILSAEEARRIESELAPYYDIFGERWAAE
jgi:hypothetical protein